MIKRQPPVAKRLKPAFYVLRAFSALLLVLGLWVAWLLVDDDQGARAVLIVIAVGGFVAATWLSPFSTGMRIAAVTSAVAIALASGSPLFGLILVVGLVVVLIGARLVKVRVNPDSVRAVFRDDVMPGAERFVGDFVELGWNQVGAVGFDVLRRTVVESVLLSPDRTQYACVTDMVMTVTSQIDDVRDLVTRNTAAGVQPAGTLTNDVVGGTPHELAAAHELALSVIAPFGVEPLPLVEGLLVQQVIDDEVAALDAVDGARAAGPRAAETGPIDGSEESLERVRAWLGLEPRV